MESLVLEGFDADLELMWPELQRVARPARERRRLNPEIFTALVVELCERAPLSVKELAALLNRSEAYVGDAIRPMVGGGSLSFLYPDQPKHPGQRYVAGEMAEALEHARGREEDAARGAEEGAATGAAPRHGAAAVEEIDAPDGEDAGRADDIHLDPPAEPADTPPAPPAEVADGWVAAGEGAASPVQEDSAPRPDEVDAATTPRRTPPPVLFEPTRQIQLDEETGEPAEAAPGLLFPGDDEEAEKAAPGIGVAGTTVPPSRAPEHTPGRLLSARQNIVLALAMGIVLGLAPPPLWLLWAFGLSLVLATAHIGLHSMQFESFRRQRAARGAENGGPQWILFLILKTAFTGAEIAATALLTALVRALL